MCNSICGLLVSKISNDKDVAEIGSASVSQLTRTWIAAEAMPIPNELKVR